MKKCKPLPSHIRSKNKAMLIGLLILAGLFFGLSITRIQENSRVSSKPTLTLHK